MNKNLDPNGTVIFAALELYRKVQDKEVYIVEDINRFPTAEELATMSLKDIWNLGYKDGMKAQTFHDKLCKEEISCPTCKKCKYHLHGKDGNSGFCTWMGHSCDDDFYCKDFEEKEK